MSKRTDIAIYTIGHSNHSWDHFAGLLQCAKIQVLADVRSYPRSRFAQFNQGPLETRLQDAGINYLFFGAELGGRPKSGGSFDYETTAQTERYTDALAHVVEIGRTKRTTLMCSEHEPLTCHRCLLVGRSLVEQGIAVRHILRDGSIEAHTETEDRLLTLTRRKTADLLARPEQRLVEAYRIQARALRRKPK